MRDIFHTCQPRLTLNNLVTPGFDAVHGKGLDWHSALTTVPVETIHPTKNLFCQKLETIGEEIQKRGQLRLGIVGAGNLIESFIGPGFAELLSFDRELARKISVTVMDLSQTGSREAMDTLQRVQRSFSGIPIEVCYQNHQDALSNLSGLDGVYNATPPVEHLKVSTAWLQKLDESPIPVFHEKPVCVHGEETDLRKLVSQHSDRLHLVDWVFGTGPMQYLTGTKEGAQILQRLGEPLLINGYLQESMLVDPDRNGGKGEYGLLRRRQSPYDFSVGIANDAGVHPLVGNYLLHALLKNYSPTSLIDPSKREDTKVRYARSHYHDEALDDTYGAITFDLEGTRHNVVWGKELPDSFYGFDVVGKNGNRLICCYGIAPGKDYPDGLAPYLLYLPKNGETADADCITFNFSHAKSAGFYSGILLGFLGWSVGRSDLLVPASRFQTNEAAIEAISLLAGLKKENYLTNAYDRYECGEFPSFGLPYGNNMGLGAERFRFGS